jgi:hypothetical protein
MPKRPGLSKLNSRLDSLQALSFRRKRLTWMPLPLPARRLLRKEVIQPQVPLRLPCYDFTPVTDHTINGCLPKVSPPVSGTIDSRGVTGGVYKARERIHRVMLIRDY